MLEKKHPDIPSSVMLDIVFGLDKIETLFGTRDIEYDHVIAHQYKLFENWSDNEITIKYNSENMEILNHEIDNSDLFSILTRIAGDKITVRTEKPEYLAFLKLKHGWF